MAASAPPPVGRRAGGLWSEGARRSALRRLRGAPRLRAATRMTPGLRPGSCTPASGSGRWRCIGGSPPAGSPKCSGDATLPIDKRFLTLNLRAAAEAEWQRSRPDVKAALERYAAGVNAVAAALAPAPAPDRDAAARHHAGPMDAGGHAGRGAAAGVAPGREPSVRAGARRRGAEARRRGRPAARWTIPRRCADGARLRRCPGAGPSGRRGAVDGWRRHAAAAEGRTAGAGGVGPRRCTDAPGRPASSGCTRRRNGATATTG